MLSKTVSTAISALVFVMPVLLTTSLMMSSLINACLRKFQTGPEGRIRRDNKLMIGLALGDCQGAALERGQRFLPHCLHRNTVWP